MDKVKNFARALNFKVETLNCVRTFTRRALSLVNFVPQSGSEIVVTGLPSYVFENQIFDLFSSVGIGPIYKMKLLLKLSGDTKGVCFVTFVTQAAASKAFELFNRERFVWHGCHIVVAYPTEERTLIMKIFGGTSSTELVKEFFQSFNVTEVERITSWLFRIKFPDYLRAFEALIDFPKMPIGNAFVILDWESKYLNNQMVEPWAQTGVSWGPSSSPGGVGGMSSSPMAALVTPNVPDLLPCPGCVGSQILPPGASGFLSPPEAAPVLRLAPDFLPSPGCVGSQILPRGASASLSPPEAAPVLCLAPDFLPSPDWGFGTRHTQLESLGADNLYSGPTNAAGASFNATGASSKGNWPTGRQMDTSNLYSRPANATEASSNAAGTSFKANWPTGDQPDTSNANKKEVKEEASDGSFTMKEEEILAKLFEDKMTVGLRCETCHRACNCSRSNC